MELNKIIDEIKSLLTTKRFNHVMSVANFAKDVAIHVNIDPDKAYLAGLLHDVAKQYDDKDLIEMVQKYCQDKINYPLFAYHAYVSAYLAKTRFDIKDAEILNAISSHCLATYFMSPLDKLIFISDKIEPTRPFASYYDDVRELIYEDLDKAFILLLVKEEAYLNNQGKEVVNLQDLINYYKGKLNGR